MRLHHLEVTAFGPFADTVSIDLDRLSAAGLFLLSGPTGAGKTSVLDAVCFALYGEVPGDRATAKRLRCDQAAPEVAPRVVLEATLSGRRFRLTRSPSWERPKKRGSGTTTQQATVVVQERVHGDWTTHTTRLDEAGYLIADVLGMNLTQFVQVAMLPQGRFQAFLRARSEERKELLQRLFRTERFTDVERWLRERRVALRRQSEAAHQLVADVVSRTSEVTGEPLPPDWDIQDLALPAADGSVSGWVGDLAEAARAEQERAATAAGAAVAAEAEARAALEQGRALAERRARLDAAAAEHRTLQARRADHDADVAAVDAAGRAARVVPAHTIHQRALRAHAAAQAALPAAVDRPSAAARVEALTIDLADARALLPREQRLHALHADISACTARIDGLSAQVDQAAQRLSALPSEIAALEEQILAARDAATRVESLTAQVTAHLEAEDLRHRLAEAECLHAEAREQALTLRTRALDVRQARLESMAAELAGALAVGGSCPVCGSCEHPRKATPAHDAPDAAAEKAAEKAAADASAVEHLRSLEVRELATLLDQATARLGDADPGELHEALAAATATAGALGALEAGLASCRSEAAKVAEHRLDLARRLAEEEAAHRHLTAEQTGLTDLLRAALAGSGAGDVATLVADLEAQLVEARQVVARIEAAEQAEVALAEAAAAVESACAEAGFTDLESALAAALPADQVEAAVARIKHHERRLAAVTEVLEEPGADEVAARPLPDLDACAAAHEAALAELTSAQTALERAVTRLARTTALQSELHEQLRAWGPLREDLEVTSRLAAFAEGKSPDNQLQMSLSAYVVAYRLTQVVAAANERLARMSDQRYSLEHSLARGAGDRRGGLALAVRDDWSGETRDPATLSGGETFVVSLALALGLADVITQEAGGADLDTLFVDEGFGSLDADTLDDVMDTLDTLRDGGRVVGVVSHVAEMRDRIPTQLLVRKARTGSSIAIR